MTAARSVRDYIGSRASKAVERRNGRAWPAPVWQKDPEGFAFYILGVTLWRRQVEILEAVRDNPRVSVVGGRKIGKDFALGVLASWWYASFPDARVFMTATTGKQIDGILYRQVRILIAGSGRCYDCKRADDEKIRRGIQPDPPPCTHSAVITGDVGKRAHTGVVAPDLREIKGVTADKAEGIQGWSGKIMALTDEASGVEDQIQQAIRGNLAGEGCKEVAIGNGTRAQGWFFESHHGKSASLYKTFAVSSLETPNYIEGRPVFPGLASREWVEECRVEWGEDSPLFKIHVLGLFVQNEQGAIFSVHAISSAVLRWDDTPAEGPLQIGIDPAGDSGDGDESGFAATRGKKMIRCFARLGLTADGHVTEALGLIVAHRDPASTEKVRVVIDSEGEVGAKVRGAFVAYQQAHGDACPFVVVVVRSSERAKRQQWTYDRIRDELCGNFADWLRNGGAIPEDTKLAKDLSVFRWRDDQLSGRSKAIDKKEIKKLIGRSPDRGDAAMLSVWMPVQIGATAAAPATTAAEKDPYTAAETTFDPYSALDAFRH